MRGRIFLGILSMMAMMVACKKERSIVVQGHVTLNGTGESIEDAVVEVSYRALGNASYSAAYSSISQTVTGTDGAYRLEFDPVSAANYRLKVSKADHYAYERVIERDRWSVRSINVEEIQLNGKAWISMHFVSDQPSSSLLFRLNEHSPGCPECCGTQTLAFTGVTDTLISCPVFAQQKISYEATIVSGSKTESIKAEIEVLADTAHFELRFD